VQELFSPFTAKYVVPQPRHLIALIKLLHSHKRIREMEHELFQSKLKPSVDDALLFNIIRSSSSGEYSHRAAAMELVFERSIQGRRKRDSAKVKDSLQPDPAPQLKGSEPLETPNPPAELPIPAPTLPLPPQPLPNASTDIPAMPAPSFATHEAPLNLPTLSEPAQKTNEATLREEPQADAKTNPPPSEDTTQLACSWCGAKQRRSDLRFGIRCGSCPIWFGAMKCVGCGSARLSDIEACTYCRRKFEK
jgi:hypothetical protein